MASFAVRSIGSSEDVRRAIQLQSCLITITVTISVTATITLLLLLLLLLQQPIGQWLGHSGSVAPVPVSACSSDLKFRIDRLHGS